MNVLINNSIDRGQNMFQNYPKQYPDMVPDESIVQNTRDKTVSSKSGVVRLFLVSQM